MKSSADLVLKSVLLTLCMLGNFACFFVVCGFFFFFKLTFSKKIFQEHHQGVKQIGSRSGPMFLSGLIWIQTICKGYKQMSKFATCVERVEVDILNPF